MSCIYSYHIIHIYLNILFKLLCKVMKLKLYSSCQCGINCLLIASILACVATEVSIAAINTTVTVLFTRKAVPILEISIHVRYNERENYTTVYCNWSNNILSVACSCLCLSVHIKWWIIQSESLMRQWIKATIHWTTPHIMNCTVILDLGQSDMLLHQDWREIRSTQQ